MKIAYVIVLHRIYYRLIFVCHQKIVWPKGFEAFVPLVNMMSSSVSISQGDSKINTSQAQFNVWRRHFPSSSLLIKDAPLTSHSVESDEGLEALNKMTIQRMSVTEVIMLHLSKLQTKILATLVPDEILRMLDTWNGESKIENKTFTGVMLFGDVSGFTALCEKYNNTGKGGTYRLSATLNGYIGSMVEVIYSHGGDVLKFSGDAFLAAWRVNKNDLIYKVIHNVIECALYIQSSLGKHETDVKVLLTVKLAISAGNMTFAIIGNDKNKHYLAVGSPIDDVKMAERVCMSGEVTLSPSAWGHCSESNYEYTYKDEQHVKVTHILYNPTVEMGKRKVFIQTNFNQTGRLIVDEAAEKDLGDKIRPFIISPVLQQVDADQPLKYLTELRQVTTMFVNIVPRKIAPERLVKMVDSAYLSIDSLAQKYIGVLNKVSMFDKDVMFLIAFGLRGFKQESESARALQCAHAVYHMVLRLGDIKSVSVGITTGMTYCGIVGHSQRKEYTVLGATVNKAARIMCAYPNMITCDQNTFLHSKMSADLFILQETRELKGIGNVGAIYEYKEEVQSFHTNDKLLSSPLLGRKAELELVDSLLDCASEPMREHSGLIIKGDARIGKSRLLKEVVQESARKGFTPLIMALNEFYMNIPYSAVYDIFRQALGLEEGATLREKQKRLMLLLHFGETTIDKGDLCYLNNVMQVKFPQSLHYISETPEEHMNTLYDIFKQLMHLCSLNLVIAIDDAHFLDRDSWKLLKTVLDETSTLLVLTVYSGDDGELLGNVKELMNDDRLLKLQLRSLDTAYLAPLACQFLNVKAIPQELVMVLKKKSKGNPGWCESLITSLLQSGGIRITEVLPQDIQRLKLVEPHVDLIEKIPINNLFNTKPQEKFDNSHFWMVCLKTENFNINENIISQNIDALIIRAFDCLTPYEQVLLKCASVLGGIFTRGMLIALMHNHTPLSTAKAIRHLFDMRILGCGSKESSKNFDLKNYVFQNSEKNFSNQRPTAACYCIITQNDIPSELEQLPKYAYCKLIQFKIPAFQTVTYNLLPGNQKREFHSRAVDFLENHAHKCDACGGGNFVSLPIIKEADETSEPAIEKSASISAVISGKIFPMAQPSREIILNQSNATVQVRSSEELETVCLPRTRKDLRSGTYLSIEKLYPKVDFRNCECPLVLAAVYQQLIEHCAVAGLKEKRIRFLIEYGAAAVSVGQNYLARKLLMEAEELTVAQSDEDDAQISNYIRQFNLGKIHILIGQANLNLGEFENSRKHLLIGIRYFGGSFWTLPGTATPQIIYQQILHWIRHQVPPSALARVSTKQAVLFDEIAAGLSHLGNLYMVENNWKLAKYASLKSLNMAQVSNNNFCELCAAYSNVIDVCKHFGELNYAKCLEWTALRTCKDKYKGFEAKDLLSLGRLYCTIFTSRLLRGELASAVRIGFRTLRIGSRVYANNVKLYVYPLLIQAAFFTGQLGEAVDLLKELHFTSEEDLDASSSAWFYALCLDMILDTGFALEKVNACQKFCDILQGETPDLSKIVVRDVDAQLRLTLNMWLWSLRTEDRALAQKWKINAEDFKNISMDDSFCKVFSALKYLEALLISMAHSLNRQSLDRYMNFRSESTNLFKQLDTITRACGIFRPRYLLLKAYKNRIKRRRDKAVTVLKGARLLAQKHGNMLEIAWNKHNEEVWTNVNIPFSNFWREHSDSDNNVDWHEFGLEEWSNAMYSLPLPSTHPPY